MYVTIAEIDKEGNRTRIQEFPDVTYVSHHEAMPDEAEHIELATSDGKERIYGPPFNAHPSYDGPHEVKIIAAEE